jgi:lysyl-tRNA synthetase class I
MTEIYIRGPFTILCNYCGKTYGKVDEHTEVPASAVLRCPCGHETKFENMPGPAVRTGAPHE